MSYRDTLNHLERRLTEVRGPSPVDLSMADVVEDIKEALRRDDFMTDRHPEHRAASQSTLLDQVRHAQPRVDRLLAQGEACRSRLNAIETSLNELHLDSLVDRIANQYRSAGRVVTLNLVQEVLSEAFKTWDLFRSRYSLRRRLRRLKDDNSQTAIDRMQQDERRRLAIASNLAKYNINATPSVGKTIQSIKLTLPGVLGVATFAYGTFYLSAMFTSALFGSERTALVHLLTVLPALLVHPAATRHGGNRARVWGGLVLVVVLLSHLFFVISELPHHVDLLSFVRVSDIGFLIAASLFAPLYIWRKRELANFGLRTLLNTLRRVDDPKVEVFLKDRFDLFVLGLTSLTIALVASLAGIKATLWDETYVCRSEGDETITLFNVSGGRILAGVKGAERAYMESLSSGVVRRWGDQSQSQCDTIRCAASRRAGGCGPASDEEVETPDDVTAEAYAGLVDCRDGAQSHIHYFFCPEVYNQHVLTVQCNGNAQCDVVDGVLPLKMETKGLRATVVGLASSTGSASYNLSLADWRADFVVSNLPPELDGAVKSYVFGEVHPLGSSPLIM